MAEWIISGNPNKFDIINAFRDLRKLDRAIKANMAVGDVVYLYVSGDIKALVFKCRVNKVGVPTLEIDDRQYDISGEFDGNSGPYVELEMLEELSGNAYSYAELEKHGFKAPQGPVHMPDSVKAYLDSLVSSPSENIDFIGVLDYLEHNREVPYSDPDADGVELSEKDHLLQTRKNAQDAVEQLKKMAALCTSKFGLINSDPINWLDNSKSKMRSNLTVQMKYNECLDKLPCIAIIAEMKNAEESRYRISLDANIDGASKDAKASYHSHLDLPLNASQGLVYVYDANEFGAPKVINDSQSEIKEKVKNRELRKVQISKYLGKKDYSTNEAFRQGLLDAVKALLPYYNHVVGKDSPSDEYWPSLAEYNPGISKEQWMELLQDPIVTFPENLQMLQHMLELGGEATCTKLAEVYGGSPSGYSSLGTNLGGRVHKTIGCPLCIDDDTLRLYTVPFVGRYVTEDGAKRYSWKLRNELKEALEEMDLTSEKPVFDKNMILYGPPGTGKTYKTAVYAVAICDHLPLETLEKQKYSDTFKRYEELKNEGRVAFTTFHQSYSYEEFIEGIKPVMAKSEGNNAGNDIKYDVFDGVFKAFCEKARTATVTSTSKDLEIQSDASVWKTTIKSLVKQDCFDNGWVRIDWGFESEGAAGFVEDIHKGDIILTTDGSRTYITGIALVTEEDAVDLKTENNATCRAVKWLAKDLQEDITGLNNGKILQRRTVARVPNMSAADAIALAKRMNPTNQDLADTTIVENNKPYVFVIDEINRGNISKIFGELITLIEDTKRAGSPEEASAILPYSGEKFSVPSNVYLLGTMNTADRSIALMDTALRRRFQFVEMMPNADILRTIGADQVENIDVAKMLETINKRICYFYDREHTIGHAFFTKLAKEATMEALASVFEKSVIPLLQEYFYEDYQKIQMVLGDNDKNVLDEDKFILNTPVVARNIFKGDTSDLDLPENEYSIQPSAFLRPSAYKKIYE